MNTRSRGLMERESKARWGQKINLWRQGHKRFYGDREYIETGSESFKGEESTWGQEVEALWTQEKYGDRKLRRH